MRELSSLAGLEVIATDDGRRLGTVAEPLVDLAAGELVGVTLAKTPEMQVILAEDISIIGPDAVMIPSSEALRSREEVGEALARGRRVLGEPPTVITDRGARLGELGSVHIDEGSKRIIRFEVSGGTFRDVTEGVLAMPPMEGIVHGEDTIIVPHEVVARRLHQASGLRGTFRSLAQRLRGGMVQMSERSDELLREGEQRLKRSTHRVRKRAEEFADEAREKADELADEAREAVEKAREAAKAEREEEAAEEPEEEQEQPQEPQKEPEEGDTSLAPGPATPPPERVEEGPQAPEDEDTDSEEPEPGEGGEELHGDESGQQSE